MSQEQLSEQEIAMRFKKANAQGFVNHMVAAAGATPDQAAELFKKSDAKADKLLQKRAAIRESIIDEIKGGDSSANLPENLRNAAAVSE